MLHCLRVLAEHDLAHARASLPPLLGHADPTVRAMALQVVERHALRHFTPALRATLEDEADTDVRMAAIMALAATSEDSPLDEVGPYLDASCRATRHATMVALMVHGGVDALTEVWLILARSLDSPDPAERCSAIAMLEKAGNRSLFRPIRAALDDGDREVRLAAVQAAGVLRSPMLWRELAALLEDPHVGRAAVSALGSSGDPVLPFLAGMYDADAATTGIRRRVAEICGRLASPAAAAFLVARLPATPVGWADELLDALARCAGGRPVDRRQGKAVWLYVERALARGRALRAALAALARHPAALVRSALEECLQRERHQVLLALELVLVPPRMVRDARERWRTGSGEQRAIAIEMVEQLLPGERKRGVLSLLDEPGHGTRGDASAAGAAIAGLARDGGPCESPWVRMCARQWIGGAGDGVTCPSEPPLGDDAMMLETIERVVMLKSIPIFAGWNMASTRSHPARFAFLPGRR